jgi:membrane dipeptidase
MSRDFHDQLVVIDGLQYSNWDRALFEELRAGGLSAVHVTLAYWENARETLGVIARWHRWFQQHGDLLLHARSAADILEAKRTGRTAIVFGFQNCSPIEDDLGLVSIFHALGVRVMQLTYNDQSLLGGGCYEPSDSGLSRFGREVVQEMNRVGMLIDLSHSGERTTLEAIEASSRPVVISHANPHAFHPVPRNKSERVLRSLAERGGMLGFSLYPLHIGGADRSLESFCAMVARTVELMGIDHVGFGTDTVRNWPDSVLDWMRHGRSAGRGAGEAPSWPQWPPWYRTPADLPNLTAGLLDAGFSRQEVAKIMGGNWLRCFAEGFEPADAAAPAAIAGAPAARHSA